MKKKYLVPAAAAAAALVLLAAALLWYGRSRSFRAVFPLSGSVEVSCRAQWTPEEGQGYARDLTGEQTSQVLGALKEQQLRRRYGDLLPWGGEGPVTSSMGESLLLTFRDRAGCPVSCCFGGPDVAPRPGAGLGASYSLSGGQVFQEELTGVVYELVRPKAETVGTVYADLDGDGSDETVRLCAEETVEPDEAGSLWSPMRRPCAPTAWRRRWTAGRWPAPLGMRESGTKEWRACLSPRTGPVRR